MKKYKILTFHSEGMNEGQIRDEFHIKDALRELGHETFTNDESKLSEVDLVLAFNGNQVSPERIRKFKTLTKAPIWFWTFDNCDRRPAIYEIIKEVDLWLGEELGRSERFKQEKLPFYYFPNHAVNEKIFRPFDLPKIYDVSFSGTPYFQERTDMLKAIEDAGIDLHIFGNISWEWKNKGFKNVHGSAFDEELAKVVSQSKIVVGISNTMCYGYYSIRPSQVMLCGGFMIDKYVLGMERELRDGCEYWNTYEELVEKIKYYLEHEDERNAIAKRGYEIALTTLTNKSRCAELIKLFENYNKFNGTK
jgi:spore maturation protein CgeB